jgi:hypothetical protein
MGDDADGLVALPQALERVQGDVEGLWIERDQALVDESDKRQVHVLPETLGEMA